MSKQSVVLVPFTYQGHITPMLQLGTMLHSKGFSVIVAHPDFNSPNPLNHPDFIFLPLDTGLSSSMEASALNALDVISACNQHCGVCLTDSLAPVMKDEAKYGKISCIIYDINMRYGNLVADRLKIPSLVLNTNSAVYTLVCRTVLQLHKQDQIPLQESRLLDEIPDVHALRYKDLGIHELNMKIPDVVVEFVTASTEFGSSAGIILNSSEVLDHIALSELKKHYNIPFFPIGPFEKMASTTSSTSYINEDTSCIAWLEKQSHNSVLYISFGTSGFFGPREVEETAWGLANSGIPFLWVLRPAGVELPQGFLEKVGDRGYIVQWAPQRQVLAHSSVGGFLSHCGWNSTLESISHGVPMICRPFWGDQIANTRYITHVWNVGIELQVLEDRAVFERTVKRLMVEDEGKEVRQRMMALKTSLDVSTQEGGSSYQYFDDLINFIQSGLPA